MGLLEGRAGSERHNWESWSGMRKVFFKIYLAALGLSCSMWDLGCIMSCGIFCCSAQTL